MSIGGIHFSTIYGYQLIFFWPAYNLASTSILISMKCIPLEIWKPSKVILRCQLIELKKKIWKLLVDIKLPFDYILTEVEGIL
jgi:hypothetical protein